MTFNQTTFRYLNDLQACWREEEPVPCVVCGLSRPGYAFLQEAEVGYDECYVCEPCLVAGRISEVDLRVNDGDIDSLRQQLSELMPHMTEEEREALVEERTAEVEQRTPRPDVLNLFTWPAHCGDYCVYHRHVDAEDLNRIAPDSDGKAFLMSHLHEDDADVDEEFIDDVWKDDLKGFIRFYLWRCSQCHVYLITWDSE